MNEREKGGERDVAGELRLRREPPRVTRLSRRVLTALAALAAISVSGALIWALYQGQTKSTGTSELYNTENKPTPDGLAMLPHDYAGLPSNIPVLGPPLPGDLGRPIRNGQLSGPGEGGIDAEQQRTAQETEAARTSRLFATTTAPERPTTAVALDPDALPNMQDRKLAFLTAAVA